MAPVLQCPDCGEKHPLAKVPSSGAFPCQGCGRVLKVPEQVAQRAAAARPVPVASAVASPAPVASAAVPAAVASATAGTSASSSTAESNSTRIGPAVDGEALGALSGRSGMPAEKRLGSVPWWMRLLLWIVAVPLGFLIVVETARALGFFTTNQLSDLFLANDQSRFWPLARLLPFVALVTALLVQGGVYVLARWRGRRGERRLRARQSGAR